MLDARHEELVAPLMEHAARRAAREVGDGRAVVSDLVKLHQARRRPRGVAPPLPGGRARLSLSRLP